MGETEGQIEEVCDQDSNELRERETNLLVLALLRSYFCRKHSLQCSDERYRSNSAEPLSEL